MSRSALYEAIVNDSVLNSLGINENTVFPNYALQERPVDNGAFVILRWGGDTGLVFGSERQRGPQSLTIWVHYPIKLSNDYNRLIDMLDKIDDVLFSLRDVVGEDNYTLSFVEIGGRSDDLFDDGFETITKNASYQLHSRRSAA